MILIIDNYDSFTFNLVQYMYQLNLEVIVKRNDDITIKEIRHLDPTHIVISPGPGNPDSSGISLKVVQELYREYPILGVCLGHQTIAQAFGGKVIKAKEPTHGKISMITHDGKGIFQTLDNPLQMTRYHSLMLELESLPKSLEVSAYTEAGDIAALRHREYPIEGIQGHPESVLSRGGLQLLKNFFELKGVKADDHASF